jgi:hypothetical protein
VKQPTVIEVMPPGPPQRHHLVPQNSAPLPHLSRNAIENGVNYKFTVLKGIVPA